MNFRHIHNMGFHIYRFKFHRSQSFVLTVQGISFCVYPDTNFMRIVHTYKDTHEDYFQTIESVDLNMNALSTRQFCEFLHSKLVQYQEYI